MIERLHVTLCHVGDYVGRRAHIVARAPEAANRVSASAFDVTFNSALSFAGRPRYLPVGLWYRHGASGVEAFQRRLGAEMTACGLGNFVRPYTPHMLLLYDTADATEHSIEPTGWTACECVLIHSMLGQTRHVRLGLWPLGEQAVRTPMLEAAI